MLKAFVKSLLYAASPRLATSVMSARSRAHSQRVLAGWGCPAVNDAMLDRLGDRVVGGPFRGMVLTPKARAEQIGPYLLGVYESELLPAWEVALRGRFAQVVDIGSKFGYYAVGLARLFPSAEVVAFDTDPWARSATRELAAANDARNVRVEGFCDAGWLDRHLSEGALVVSDCEGYEGALFGTRPIRNLPTATLLVETHDAIVPGVEALIEGRLAATHEVQFIRTGEDERAAPEGVDLSFVEPSRRHLALQEVRLPQSWMFCLPRTGPNAGLLAEAGRAGVAVAGASTPNPSGAQS